MVIWICFEAKSYFFPIENWHFALLSYLLKFGEIVFVPLLISHLHIVCTPNLLNPSVPMETIVSLILKEYVSVSHPILGEVAAEQYDDLLRG